MSEKPSCKIRFAKVGCRQDWQPKKKQILLSSPSGQKRKRKAVSMATKKTELYNIQTDTHTNVEEEELERVLLREERETKAKGDP